MPSSCAVAKCSNSGSKPGIHYFKFPKNPEIRNKWIYNCYRKDTFNPDSCTICSEHFNQYDIEIHQDYNVRLKKNVIPTEKLFADTGKKIHYKLFDSRKRNMELQKMKEKESLELKKNQNVEAQPSACTSDQLSEPNTNNEATVQKDYQLNELRKLTEILRSENSLLNDKIKQIQIELNNKIKSLENELKNKTDDNNFLRKVIANQNKKLSLEEEKRKIFNNFFTESQLSMLLKTKKRVTWSEKDISTALTLRYFSKKCYIYLKRDLNYPLPGFSTLNAWVNRIQVEKGLLKRVLKLLEISGRTMSELDKLVVLELYATKITEKLEYDAKADQIIGPHKYLYVVQAKSLCAKWKQLVYYQFDREITVEILVNIVNELANIGYRVVACVHDCGPASVTLYNCLDITVNKTWMEHPSMANKRIFFFANASQLLISLRNWLLDAGFLLGNGKEISIFPFLSLLDVKNISSSSSNDVNLTITLTAEHLECNGLQRERVQLAAELLSHPVALALKQYKCSGTYSDEYKYLADFITIVRNWFDVMNSNTTTTTTVTTTTTSTTSPSTISSLPLICGYGKAKMREDQDDALDKCRNTIAQMKCVGQTELQRFQENILISTLSLKQLYDHLNDDTSIPFILTHTLNQDTLFSGSEWCMKNNLNDHSTALDALKRLRNIILGRTNTTDGNMNVEYLVGRVLQQVGIHQKDSITSLDEPDAVPSTLTLTSDDRGNTVHSIVDDEDDGVEYLAGWIAKKIKKTHPDLVKVTKCKHKNDTLPNWLCFLSDGRYTQPSDEFLAQCHQMNDRFKMYFGENINYNEKIVSNLTKQIKTELNIDDTLVRRFVLQRIYLKINYLNNMNGEESGTTHKPADNKLPNPNERKRKRPTCLKSKTVKKAK